MVRATCIHAKVVVAASLLFSGSERRVADDEGVDLHGIRRARRKGGDVGRARMGGRTTLIEVQLEAVEVVVDLDGFLLECFEIGELSSADHSLADRLLETLGVVVHRSLGGSREEREELVEFGGVVAGGAFLTKLLDLASDCGADVRVSEVSLELGDELGEVVEEAVVDLVDARHPVACGDPEAASHVNALLAVRLESIPLKEDGFLDFGDEARNIVGFALERGGSIEADSGGTRGSRGSDDGLDGLWLHDISLSSGDGLQALVDDRLERRPLSGKSSGELYEEVLLLLGLVRDDVLEPSRGCGIRRRLDGLLLRCGILVHR